VSTTPTGAIETLLSLPPLQFVVEKEAKQAATPTIFKNQTVDILQFSIWQWKISQFYWLFLTVCYRRYLVENIWWNMPLGKYGYLNLKHSYLPMT
jgi:hypothetical protein